MEKCGISLSGLSLLTFIIFAILKGCNAITWDWVYVCIPLMVIGVIVGIFAIIIAIIFIVDRVIGIKNRKEK